MIFSYLHKIYNFFTYVIAPPYCLFCRKSMQDRHALCPKCLLMVVPIVPFDFHIGRNQNLRVYALSAYKDPLKKLILAKHYNNAIPSIYIAKMICELPILEYLEFDMIVFIPLHWTRYADRGFNQSEIFAREIAKKTGKPVVPLLIRSKKTAFQASLSAHQREQNVKDAFNLNAAYQHNVAGKKILIVDDLFTTGSTIKSAAQLLFIHKVLQVDVVVACRVIT